jgi:hypothetical protein
MKTRLHQMVEAITRATNIVIVLANADPPQGTSKNITGITGKLRSRKIAVEHRVISSMPVVVIPANAGSAGYCGRCNEATSITINAARLMT